MNENGIEYQSDFRDTPFSESLIANTQEYTGQIELTMGEAIDSYYKEASSVISDAISKNDIVSSCVCDILGVNVYNAVYYNNHIISRYCVMYGDEKSPKVEYGNFVIETNDYKKMSKLYRF